MSRPEVDNVPDLFQMVNETLIPNRIQRIKEASEHSIISGQMERSEISTNLGGGSEKSHGSHVAQHEPSRKPEVPNVLNGVGTGGSSGNYSVPPAQNFTATPVGWHTLSASVRDRTAQLATALDAENIFDGETYEPEKDRTRLKAQLVRVRELMRDGVWRSLSEISKVTGDPESSVSARLRDLRKPKFGLWTVDRKRRTNGLWEYRLGGKGL